MNRFQNRLLGAMMIALLCLAGCGPDSESADAPPIPDTKADNKTATGEGRSGQADEEPVSALAFVDAAAEGAFAVEIERGAPEPTTIEIGVVAEGSGRHVGTNGVAVVRYVTADWNGELVQRSSDVNDRLSVTIGTPSDSPPDAVTMPDEIETALIGKPVGTRLTVAIPAGTIGMPRKLPADGAHLLVLDVVAFQTPEAP